MPGQSINHDIIAGKLSTYKDLQNRYFGLVYDLVRKMGGGIDGENAKSVYAETIAKLHMEVSGGKIKLLLGEDDKIRIDNENKENALLSTYLYKIARIIWLNSPVNPNNNDEIALRENSVPAEDKAKDEEIADDTLMFEQTIEENFNKLGLACQMMILLKKICNVSHEEIAEFRGSTGGASRNLFVTCWKNLVEGKAAQRQGKGIKPTESKIKVENLVDVFLDDPLNNEQKWLLSELAEKEYYHRLHSDFKSRLYQIKDRNPEIKTILNLVREIISFLDEKQSVKLDLYKEDKNDKSHYQKRNLYFESKFLELDISSRFILLLYHIAHADILKIAEFFKIEDDISTKKRIHESKIEMADNIRSDKTKVYPLFKNTQHD